MKIKDLIEALQQYDPEIEVLLADYQGGLYRLGQWGHLQVYHDPERDRFFSYGDVRGQFADKRAKAQYEAGELNLTNGLLLE